MTNQSTNTEEGKKKKKKKKKLVFFCALTAHKLVIFEQRETSSSLQIVLTAHCASQHTIGHANKRSQE